MIHDKLFDGGPTYNDNYKCMGQANAIITVDLKQVQVKHNGYRQPPISTHVLYISVIIKTSMSGVDSIFYDKVI